jgi:hypothetical protein
LTFWNAFAGQTESRPDPGLLDALQRARRATTRWLPIAIAAIGVLHAGVTWFLAEELPWLVDYVHVDREHNLPTWFAATQLALLAGLFAAMGFLAAGRGRRAAQLPWLLCAIAALFLSLDEATGLHEAAGTLLGESVRGAPDGSAGSAVRGFPSYYWALVYAPLGAPVLALSARYFWRELAVVRWRAIGALGLYLLGAVVLDHIEGHSADHGWIHVGPLLFDVFLAEELLELIGVALLVSALFDEVVRRAERQPEPAPLSGRLRSASRAAP